MKERNIQSIRLLNNISKAIMLSGPNDTRLPKQSADDIQCTQGVTQISTYQSDAKRKTCGFRTTIKSSESFSKYIFYICDVRLVCICENQKDFKTKFFLSKWKSKRLI